MKFMVLDKLCCLKKTAVSQVMQVSALKSQSFDTFPVGPVVVAK